jgi:hypothetical protein
MLRMLFKMFVLLAAAGCAQSAPPLPADVLPLPENPSAEIAFLQSYDHITSMRVRMDNDWIDVPADRVHALFAALHPAGLATKNASRAITKCDLSHEIQIQGDDAQSLTVYVTLYGYTEGFEAKGEYRGSDRTIPVHYFGHDALRLRNLLSEIEMAAHEAKR